MSLHFTQVYGNLFDSNVSLAHCVSEDLRMGMGIAAEFKRRFGRVDELKAQSKNKDNLKQF